MKSKLLAGAASLILVSGALAPAHAETVTYTYDALGRLLTASTTGGATTTYTYDANGNRTQVATTGGNTPPVANADSRSTPINTADVFNSPKTNDTDANGGTLSVTAVSNATNGTVSRSGDTVTFTPTLNFTGTGGYDYTLSDGQGGTATGRVTVTVTAGNQWPTAVNDSAFVNRNTIRVIAVLGNDTDPEGQPLTITSATGATKGALLILSGTQIRYTPTNATSFGADSFTYTISDGNGGTATATVNLIYNDKPVAVDDTRSTALNTADVFNSPKTNDTDADGDTLTVSALSGATGGTATRSGSTVTFTPTTGFTGAGGYDYTANDGRGGTDTGHVTVNVGGAGNVAPWR